VLLGESLVLEFGTVNGLAASAVTSGKVTTLDHELLDDAVEDGALVVEGLARLANALLAGAETAEVLSGLGNQVGVQLHGDAASGPASDGDVKEDAGPRGLGVGFGGHCVVLCGESSFVVGLVEVQRR
jgi:hypothetical protein